MVEQEGFLPPGLEPPFLPQACWGRWRVHPGQQRAPVVALSLVTAQAGQSRHMIA